MYIHNIYIYIYIYIYVLVYSSGAALNMYVLCICNI